MSGLATMGLASLPPALITEPRDTRVDVRLKRAFRDGSMPRQLVLSGAAGTGKTFGILRILHMLAADYPDLRILFCRQTRVSLTESVLVTFEQEILPSDGMGHLTHRVSRRNRASYEYPSGSAIVLGGLDRPDKILSTAWDIVYLNEATEAEDSAWDTLYSRLRRPGRPSRFGYLIGDTNPGDPNHWIKKRADDGELALWDTSHRANPRLYDGRTWTEEGVAYIEGTLGRLKGTRRKRLLDGLWVAGEGAWFETFDPSTHVRDTAEFDPRFNVHLSVDTGVHTGAVLWQVKGSGDETTLTVFADYYSERMPAYENAQAILKLLKDRCGGRFDVGRLDPSGNSQLGFGSMTVESEFLRAGLRLQPWPKFPGSRGAGLTILESFVATEPTRLAVHPRCLNLIDALANYKRAKRRNQYIDEPEDPQHPYEESIDALRSGLLDKFPEGRKPERPKIQGPVRKFF
jgi:PBSX family phage terminase large subunit